MNYETQKIIFVNKNKTSEVNYPLLFLKDACRDLNTPTLVQLKIIEINGREKMDTFYVQIKITFPLVHSI